MTALVISVIGAVGTCMSVVVVMYYNARKLSQATVDRLIAAARQQTELSRDIRDNTGAVARAVQMLEKQDAELRDLALWRVATDAELRRLEAMRGS